LAWIGGGVAVAAVATWILIASISSAAMPPSSPATAAAYRLKVFQCLNEEGFKLPPSSGFNRFGGSASPIADQVKVFEQANLQEALRKCGLHDPYAAS